MKKQKPTKLNWYAVKSVYRTEAKGRPKNKDKAYRSDLVLIEERIVIFQAKNPDEAFNKAAKEAKSYIEEASTTNIYGQKVSARRLKHMQAYDLDEPPGEGIEIWSRTEDASALTSDRSLIQSHFRPEPDHGWKGVLEDGRLKFVADWIGRGLKEQMEIHKKRKR